MMSSHCGTVLVGALLASVAYADSALAQVLDGEDELALVYGSKLTVSIATGHQQSLRRAPAVATVITADEIAAMGARDLDEVLETVPGIHVSRAANTYSPLYVIRGIYSAQNPQTLVLQNGVPMTTMFIGNKGNIWGGFPVDHIARVEIIRGPGSALYGADAYSGVINIITKTAAQIPGTQFGVEAGSFGTRSVWVQQGGDAGPISAAGYLRVGSTDGHKRIIDADAQTERDRRVGTTASLAPGPVNTGYDAVDANIDLQYQRWILRFGYKLRDDVGTGAGISSALDPVGKERSERITTDLSWTAPHLGDDWSAGFNLSHLQYKQRMPTDLQLYPPGTRFPTGLFPTGMIGHPDTSERHLRISAFTTYTGFAGHNIRIGAGYDDLDLYHTATFKNYVFNENGVPVPVGPVADYSVLQPFMLPQARNVRYLFAQDEWQVARDWTLTAGLRHDSYSDFGGTTNPRLALVWDASLDLTAKVLYGHAFRAPSFNEQYSINNPVAVGNPALRPETIRTLETAFSWQLRNDAELNLSLYRYSMRDIIRTVANTPPVPGATYFNTGSQKGTGAELELGWDVTRALRLSASYAYQRSIDQATQQDAGFAPHQQLYARADWRFTHGWQLSPQINWVADRKRASGDARPPVPDYTTFDLALRSHRGREKWDVSVVARNLFNADAREPSTGQIPFDLPLARRAVYVQAVYHM